MTDFSQVREEFDEAVNIRKELNSIHWKDYEALKVVFGALFGEDKNTLKIISDMNYYTGGYPGENSPAKIDALLSKVGTIAKFFELIDRLDELNSILALHGFKISKLDQISDHVSMNREALNENKKVDKATTKVMNRFGFVYKEDTAEMVKWFLEQTKTLQGHICGLADEIKIDLYAAVEEKLEGQIDKAGFNSAVNVIANKQLKEEANKDINPLVEKALEKSEVLSNNSDFLREKVTEKTAS